MRNFRFRHSITETVSLLLVALFGVFLLYTLVTGVRICSTVTERCRDTQNSRLACSYLITRFQQTELAVPDAEEFAGLSCLVLRESYGGEDFVTRIYCYGGYMRELFTGADCNLPPEAGEKLLPMEKMEIAWENGCLAVDLTDTNGETRRLYLYREEISEPEESKEMEYEE